MKETKTYEINVDFFKPQSGKWYSGGTVKVDHYLFEKEFKQDIVNNQKVLHDGWQGEFVIVTDNNNDDDPFAKRIFRAEEFIGVRRQLK